MPPTPSSRSTAAGRSGWRVGWRPVWAGLPGQCIRHPARLPPATNGCSIDEVERRYELEQLQRSMAAMPPGQLALRREAALEILVIHGAGYEPGRWRRSAGLDVAAGLEVNEGAVVVE